MTRLPVLPYYNALVIIIIPTFFLFPASLMAAVFFIGASYAECNQSLVIMFFTIAISSNCLSTAGTLVNSLDLTARFVGPLSSIVNGLGAFIGIIAPYTVGHLTPTVSEQNSYNEKLQYTIKSVR